MSKILWILLCTFIVIAFTTSCGGGTPTGSPTTTTKEPISTAPSVVTTTSATSGVPKYGGVLSLLQGSDVTNFEEVFGWYAFTMTMRLTHEELWGGDWAKGSAGTGEAEWTALMTDRWDMKVGYIAESWDFSNAAQGVLTFNIRKGIHWALDPENEASRLVNGRELTADDVVFSLLQQTTIDRTFIYRTNPALRTAEITAPDKYTVRIEVTPNAVPEALLRFGECVHIVPQEVVKKYGSMQDWKTAVGSGPFILADFVSNSQVTLEKNTTYWGTDPVGFGKGNKVPYIDKIKMLIITDASTQLSAFRTGKIDTIAAGKEDADILLKEKPELLYKLRLADDPRPTHMRTDKPPFDDIRVRQALIMGIDYDLINEQLFYGEASIISWPIQPYVEYKDAYLGLDDPVLPAVVKEIYTYNPDKAKALLKEAGFPDGFKASVTTQTSDIFVDYYSILKDMWSKIGVELSINTVEFGVWQSITGARNYDSMIQGPMSGIGTLFQCTNLWGTASSNQSYVNDDRVLKARNEMIAMVALGDQAGAAKLHKELMAYVLEQSWAIPYPNAYSRQLWWPWLKNYHGEQSIGYQNHNTYATWVWIDQDLKEEMVGKR